MRVKSSVLVVSMAAWWEYSEETKNVISCDVEENSADDNKVWWRDDIDAQSEQQKPEIDIVHDGSGIEDESDDEIFHDALPPRACSNSAEEGGLVVGRKVKAGQQTQVIEIKQREKLRLLQKLIDDSKVRFACHFSTEGSNVSLTGEDKCVIDCSAKVYLIMASFESGKVDISSGTVTLLSRPAGEKWLEEQISKNELCVVAYVSGSGLNIISDTSRSVTEARKILQTLLSTVKVSFVQHDEKYLKSRNWEKEITSLMSSRMLLISTMYEEMTIIIDGCSVQVKKAVEEVNELLRTNRRDTQEIKLAKSVYKILNDRRDDVEKCATTAAKILDIFRINFDPNTDSIRLSGMIDDVKASLQLIKSKFVDVIICEKLELQLFGLALNDFNGSGKGMTVVTCLEAVHKCSISVSLREAGSPKQPLKKPVVAPKPQKILTTTLPSTKIEIKSGSLTSFTADVLVNPLTCTTPDWSKAGTVAKAFLDDAGDDLKQELETNWPRHFGRDVISTTAFGKIACKRIYNILVCSRKNQQSVQLLEDQIKACLTKAVQDKLAIVVMKILLSQLLEDQIKECLRKAVQDKMTSIAFPPLGCGGLHYDPHDVARCFLNAQQACGQQLQITIATVDSKIREAMEATLGGVGSSKTVERRQPVSEAAPRSEFETVSGDLTAVQADAIVNLITVKSHDLSKSGVISQRLLGAAGPTLQEEFKSLPLPVGFGSDVAVTSAGGRLKAKKIYHAAVRKHKDSKSNDLMYKTICKCLKMADDDQEVSSIAFSTLGCGKLRYQPADVIDCFVRAKRDTKAAVKVIVVAFETHLFKEFSGTTPSSSEGGRGDAHEECSVLASDERDKQNATPSGGGDFGQDTFVFEISAMERRTVDTVKEKLLSDLKELVYTDEIVDEVIAPMGTEHVQNIERLNSAEVKIEIDKTANRVSFMGKKSSVLLARKQVLKRLKSYEELERNFTHIRKTKDPKDGLKTLGSMREVIYPKYWSCLQNSGDPNKMVETRRVELKKASQLYQEIEKLITGTWESSKVGHGSDAVGLSLKNVAVRKIWSIENPSLYRAYETKRKALCLEASDDLSKFPSFKGLQGENEVVTRTLGLPLLEDELISEINEYHLLHGTKPEFVDNIVYWGLDFRMNEASMFGKGVYLGERSTKCDQYADKRDARVGANTRLYMFVVRTLLGNPHICGDPYKFVKPPCTLSTCNRDKCTVPSHHQCNSVVGPFKSMTPQVRLIFREFIVYDGSQVYPEFLVEYERLP